jgi:hypothetical protein
MRKAQAIYTYLGSMAATASLALVNTAHAAGETVDKISPKSPAGYATAGSGFNLTSYIQTLGGRAVNLLLILAGIAAVGYLIYSGILYITSAGDADKAKKARGGIINAVIGVIVIAAAYYLVKFALNIGTSVGGAVQDTSGINSF